MQSIQNPNHPASTIQYPPTMFLYIARHAWAGEHGDPRWPDDSLRELTPDGIERYTKVVKALADRGFSPDRIATSPYTRCRQTADIIASHVASNPDDRRTRRPDARLRAGAAFGVVA